jgi:MFS family permease
MNEFTMGSRSFVFICLFGFFYFGSHYLMFPTLPQYVESLGGSTSQIGLVVAFFTVVSVIFRPTLAKGADNFGRKRLMLFGAGLSVLLFSFYGRFHTIAPLYLVRALHGIAHGSCIAASFAYVADLAPVNRRGEVMGVFGVSNVFGMAFFPVLGSFIVANSRGFSTLFVVSVAVGTTAFLSLFLVDGSRPERRSGEKVRIITVIRQPAVIVASLALFAASILFGILNAFVPVFAPS